MIAVNLIPMPPAYYEKPKWLRPIPPPIFRGDGEPTADDYALARELFLALDSESQEWYRRGSLARLFAGL